MKEIRIEFKWAVIFSVMILAWMALEKVLGLHDARIAIQPKVGPFILIPSLIIYVFAQLDKRRTIYDFNMSYVEGLKSGLILTAFIVIFSPINCLILNFVLSPGFFPNAAQHAVQAGALTEEQAAAQFSLKTFIVTGIVGGAVTGVLFAALVAVFTRKKKK